VNSKPDCRRALHPHAREGILLFNRHAFFDAHESLETAWNQETGQVRDLYRGMIQAAVVYYHIERANYAGAVKVYGRCLMWLRPWVPICQGVHVDLLLQDLETAIGEVRRLGPENLQDFDLQFMKPIRWSVPDPSHGAGMVCDRCGSQMHGTNCKLECSNCGFRFDCSDLTLNFD
jgi:predicted metal-dependent hydrolase